MKDIFNTWWKPLNKMLNASYFNSLIKTLNKEYSLSKFEFNNIEIYPNKKDVFKCFECDFNKLRVVIISSNPLGKFSNGFAFGSTDLLMDTHPISNVFVNNVEEQLYNGFKLDNGPSLDHLAHQGVLLLNEELTNGSGSYHKLWKVFVAEVIRIIQEHHTGIIFCIPEDSHLVKLVNKNNHLLTFSDPEIYIDNFSNWDLDFKKINKLITEMNGEEYRIKF